ncbi:MAG: DUF433 domain-containing protein [Chloroflexi bacterium]|nr:DUF433 domain-containing protein [Chloroflexota bacterium]
MSREAPGGFGLHDVGAAVLAPSHYGAIPGDAVCRRGTEMRMGLPETGAGNGNGGPSVVVRVWDQLHVDVSLARPSGSLEGPDLWRKRLTLPTYTVAEAGRYAQAKPQSVGYWFRAGETSGPALPGRKAGERLNYFEAVELAFVAAFRSHGVRLRNLREARAYFQALLQTEYPFATQRFYTEGTRVLREWGIRQEQSEFAEVVIGDEYGQLAWAGLLGEKFRTFDYERGLALRWHVAGRNSPVQIDPRISFGAPSVYGIPTWAMRGRMLAGESVAEISDDFGLEECEVIAGLEFEGLELEAA